jgi:hypothetical protein
MKQSKTADLDALDQLMSSPDDEGEPAGEADAEAEPASDAESMIGDIQSKLDQLREMLSDK